jgi:hypothetical protein
MKSAGRAGEITAVNRLAAVDRQIKALQRERASLVEAARAEHASWETIAAALGVSRQAAWEAHRAAADTIGQIRAGSDLDEADAMALARSETRAHRLGR